MSLQFPPHSNIAADYVVANTPAYLYKKLRANDIVIRLAREASPKDLADFICEVDNTSGKNVDDVAHAYAAMVALALKASPEANVLLENIRPKSLGWYNAILELSKILMLPSATTRQVYFTKPSVQQYYRDNSSTTSTLSAHLKLQNWTSGIRLWSDSGSTEQNSQTEEQQDD